MRGNKEVLYVEIGLTKISIFQANTEPQSIDYGGLKTMIMDPNARGKKTVDFLQELYDDGWEITATSQNASTGAMMYVLVRDRHQV